VAACGQRHERRKFRLSELPVGILAGAFVAIAATGVQAEPARIAASPSSADPVQLVPLEPQDPAPAAPQVAQSGEDDTKASGEDDTKAVEEEAEAFPPETLTDRAGVETLSDVVRYAVLNHPSVKRAIAEKNGSEFAVDEEFAGYLPSVDLSARGGWEHTDSTGEVAGGGHEDRSLWNSRSSLVVDQPLFTGFQTMERLAAARHTVVGNTRLIGANGEDIALSAIQAYLDVQRNRQFVSIAEQNVPRRIPEFDLQNVVNQSLAANPRVLAIRSEIRSNRAAARAADAPFFPSVSLQLDSNYGEDFAGTEGEEYSFGAMVVLNYNLFQGGADLARKRQAVQQVNASVFEEKDLLRAITDEAKVSSRAAKSGAPITSVSSPKVSCNRWARLSRISS
jgi:outer membrane protein TolC